MEHDKVFHGSMRFIEGALTPHKGRNPLGGKDFNRFGVYATPHFLSAVVYSLSVERARVFAKKNVLIAYAPDRVEVKMEGCYWSRQPGYVYVLPANSFRALNAYEWVADEAVPILQTLTVTPEQIDQLIAEGRIVLEQDTPPHNRFVCAFMRIEERLIRFTSSLRHKLLQQTQSLHTSM